MGWLDEIDDGGFSAGSQVVRIRRKEIEDPYSGQTTLGDWASASEQTLDGAYVAASSTQSRAEAGRTQLLEEKSLYLDDPNADVQAQDRIRAGGVIYLIDGMPSADTNPWTGWQPIREIPLRRDVG